MSIGDKQVQIPFKFGFVDELSFESLYPGRNVMLLCACKALIEEDGEQQLYIRGGLHCGKTHLLTACCNYAMSLGHRIAYVPADIVSDADALLGLELLDLVCVDDVNKLPNAGEIALFKLINEIRMTGGRLVMSADRAPSDLGIDLPDLVSRMSWGPVFQMESLDDQQVRDAFVLRANSLGLKLSDEVTDFILYRELRDMYSLAENLKTLLDAAIVSKRRITIPFVKEVLGI